MSTRDPILKVCSKTVVLPRSDVDTDQILPARFLTTTTRHGLGPKAFADWRYDSQGRPDPEFALNQVELDKHRVLVTGRNFGCGSSREHAAWALLDFGLRAVISTQIADIFRANALKNGLIPVVVDETTHSWLLDNPGIEVVIDIESSTIQLPDGREASFPTDAFARYCLINGIDELGYLLGQAPEIGRFEAECGK